MPRDIGKKPADFRKSAMRPRPPSTMKTFFHPEATPSVKPLISVAASALVCHGRRAITVVESWLLSQPKLLLTVATVGIAGFWTHVFLPADAGEMPGVNREAGASAMPSAVEEAARLAFESRFVRDGDSHYSVVVSYLPSMAATFSEMGLDPASVSATAPAAQLVCMELVEIRGLRTEVEPAALTDADRLNDVRWKGRVTVRGAVERRRQLDLTSCLAAEPGSGALIPIPWTDRDLKIELPVAGRQMGLMDAAAMAMGEFMPMLGTDSGKALAESLEGGPWRDWVDCGTASYQISDVVLRGRAANSVTMESVEDAVKADGKLGLAAADKAETIRVAMNGTEEIRVFLTRPDLGALEDADFIEKDGWFSKRKPVMLKRP